MPALKVHVRPPHRHKGLMILCAVFGLICGPLYFLANEYALVPLCERLMLSLPNATPFYVLPTVVLTTLLLPAFLCALYFARACQHYKYVYFGGQVMGCCYAAGIAATIFLHERASIIDIPWWGYFAMIGTDLGVGVIVELLNLLFAAVHHNWGSTLLAQDGTLCSACGYCIAHSPSPNCPECGVSTSTPTKPLGRIYRLADLVGAQGKRLFCGLVICIMLGSCAFVWRQIPAWRFASQFKTEDSVVQRSYHDPAGGAAEFYPGAVDVGTPIEGDVKSRAIIVQQYRRNYFDSPLLQVRIGFVASMPNGRGGTFSYVQDGVPRVVCELDERQTDYAMKQGIPDSLVDALTEAADEAGWAAPGAATTWKPDVVVAAEGHFPELEKGEK